MKDKTPAPVNLGVTPVTEAAAGPFDLTEIKGKDAGRILAYLVAARSRGNEGYISSTEIEAALGLVKVERTQWKRIYGYIEELVGTDKLEYRKYSAGPWRIRDVPFSAWRLRGEAIALEDLEAFAGVQRDEQGPGSLPAAEHVSPEACELVTSAERRYRKGALTRAMDAISELDGLLGPKDPELMLVTKARKLRVLHRLNEWDLFESELSELVRLEQTGRIDGRFAQSLRALVTLCSAWRHYNLIRPSAKQHLAEYAALHDKLATAKPQAERLSVLGFYIDCEVTNLLTLLKRRLLCEFTAEHPGNPILDRRAWAMDAYNCSIGNIRRTMMNGDFELMGNYAANHAYLITCLQHQGLFAGLYRLREAAQWLTVSDRVASRLSAGSDNLWSPIYWLYLRRVIHESGGNWESVREWIEPVVRRPGKRGPRLPNPARSATCFDYVHGTCVRLLSAPQEYENPSGIPIHQVRMLIAELGKIRAIELIGPQTAQAAADVIWLGAHLDARELPAATRHDLNVLRAELIRG
ncbi:hypothetical protein FN976_18830 [Caenimonas sedimenti]|uniref:Uncharacterized protein n=1 Tax=Caenimonas sedimenti TaxID=2596921 RepID=A0A562ZLR6_9BURK|nr:hypothetical protein [Caenimonas sedimenti]TWO69347.1 hypothetical protein FN976_18830 [Caenimonas sedimenti]